MDESLPPATEADLPLQGPHWRHHDTQATFVPLKLVLMPADIPVQVMRPDVLVGRHSDADIRLLPLEVSRRHCRIVFADGRWQVNDLNSLNGVFVNGEKVKQAPLNDGDILQIGSCFFDVHWTGGQASVGKPHGIAFQGVLGSIAEAIPEAG